MSLVNGIERIPNWWLCIVSVSQNNSVKFLAMLDSANSDSIYSQSLDAEMSSTEFVDIT